MLCCTAPVPARAQFRVGVLIQEMERAQSQAIKGMLAELRKSGYQERKNIVLETRNAKGNRAALPPAVSELVGQKVDVIFTTGTSATRAAITATKATPIVFIHPANPIALGLVKPGSKGSENVTGVAAYSAETRDKRLTLLREIVPGLNKIAIFFDANNQFSRENFRDAEASAKKAGVQVSGYGIKSAEELRATLGGLVAERGVAIFHVADDLVESESDFLFETARKKKLPTMFNEESWAIRGALAGYGPNYFEMGRQAARLIDRIIKGQKPETLPLERASKFDLTLNYRTATFIGLRFSNDLLKKADKVIR